MKTGKRHAYIDVLRIAACLCVIYTHVNQYGLYMFAYREPGSGQYFAELFASMLSRMAVPTFLAISGALMLDREISLTKLWGKRILRMGLALTLFSGLFFLRAVKNGYVEPSLKVFVLGLYESQWNYAYWYLYMYMAFLIALPVLGALARAMDNRTFVYFLLVTVFFRCLLPGFEAYRWEGLHRLNGNMDLSFMTCDAVLYPFMGYFFHRRVDRRMLRRILPGLCAAALLLTAVSCLMTYRDYFTTWVAHTQTYHDLFAPVLCAAFFCGARLLFGEMDSNCTAGRILAQIGQCTFGIYLIHVCVTEECAGFGGMFDWMSGTGVLPILGSFAYCALTMLICLVPVWLIRKIPCIGKLLS